MYRVRVALTNDEVNLAILEKMLSYFECKIKINLNLGVDLKYLSNLQLFLGSTHVCNFCKMTIDDKIYKSFKPKTTTKNSWELRHLSAAIVNWKMFFENRPTKRGKSWQQGEGVGGQFISNILFSKPVNLD